MEMLNYNDFDDNLSEMCTFILLNGEDTLVNSGDKRINNNSNDVIDNNNNQTISAVTAEKATYSPKAKRGRPCARPPTKDTLNRRRKVGRYFLPGS